MNITFPLLPDSMRDTSVIISESKYGQNKNMAKLKIRVSERLSSVSLANREIVRETANVVL